MEKNEINALLEKKMSSGREYRKIAQFEVRADAADEEYIVEGYATKFDAPYVLYAWDNYEVVERVASTAFDDADMDDVIMQYDHEGRVFARNKNGTLELSVDEVGLHIRANLGGTQIGRQLYEEIKGGYTDKMSFGFTVAEDERVYTENHETGMETVTRTITKIKKLYDVSAVSIPANDATEISARNFSEGVIAEFREEFTKADKIKGTEGENSRPVRHLKGE